MKNWLNRAIALLMGSLEAPRHEQNELDWKAALSPDKKRLAEHLSALANYPGGGFLVYGVDNSGNPIGINGITGSASHFFNFYTNLEMQLGVKSINYNL